MLSLLLLTLLPADPAGVYVVERSVMLDAKDDSGAGVLIAHKGEVLVLTAAHVAGPVTPADGGWPIAVETRKGRVVSKRTAKVVHSDPALDLAIVRLRDGGGLEGVTVPAPFEIAPGDACHYCGFGGGVPWNYQRAVVNSVNDADDSLLVNGHGWFGHSGSGVFVEVPRPCGCVKLRLVGIVVQMKRYPRSPMRCVPLVKIHKALKDLK